MKFATARFPTQSLPKNIQVFTVTLALCITISVVSQLMTIEKFLPLVEQYQLPGGLKTAQLTVFILAVSGVFGLPFLLRMKVSTLFRFCSALLLNIYALTWLYLAVWQLTYHPPLLGVGIFGSIQAKYISADVLLPFACVLLVSTVVATWLLRKDLRLRRHS